MSRRLGLASLLALLMSTLLVGSGAAETGTGQGSFSQVRATPAEGHAGDTVYLSGSGLPPNQHLYVVMACPSFETAEPGNQSFVPDGPTTDARGEFSGFAFHVLTLHHLAGSPCQFYVPDGPNAVGPDLPAVFTILPASVQLDPCVRRMCVHVRSRPLRVRAGYVEKIQVLGWPGARADIAVSYTGRTTWSGHKTLDWQGYALLQIKVPAGASSPTQARIQVRLRLHDKAGQGIGHFTVIH